RLVADHLPAGSQPRLADLEVGGLDGVEPLAQPLGEGVARLADAVALDLLAHDLDEEDANGVLLECRDGGRGRGSGSRRGVLGSHGVPPSRAVGKTRVPPMVRGLTRARLSRCWGRTSLPIPIRRMSSSRLPPWFARR